MQKPVSETIAHIDAGIITYIDFVAAFDSIYHSYILKSLKQYNVPLKYVRLVAAIYQNASVRVRFTRETFQ